MSSFYREALLVIVSGSLLHNMTAARKDMGASAIAVPSPQVADTEAVKIGAAIEMM